MEVTISGNSVPLKANSLDINDAIGQRSTASFDVIDREGTMFFNVGQRVHISSLSGHLEFAGVIDRPVERFTSERGIGKVHKITCVDWTYLTDKRIIARAYENELAGDIVRDIIANYLVDDGITFEYKDAVFLSRAQADDEEGSLLFTTIQDGPNVQEAVFNYVTVTDALDSLAEKASFEWWIDRFKRIHFVDRTTYFAPVPIVRGSRIRGIEVEPEAEEYRNRQYIRAGTDVTDEQVETFRGNGSQQSFSVGFRIARVPTVEVDGVAQTVGIRGVEEGKEWYWSKGENTISQDNQSEPLSEGATIKVTYRGMFDIVVMTQDLEEIYERSEVEEGSGIYENVIDDSNISTRASAFEFGNAKLRKYGRIGKRIKFNTEIVGLQAGQMLPVNLPKFNLNSDFLIESVRANLYGTPDNKLTYEVVAVDGPASGGWAKFFKQMAQKGQAYVIRENISEEEILITLEQFTKVWDEEERPGPFQETYPSESTFPSELTLPMFEYGDRIRYLSFFDASNNEIFRKLITRRVDMDTDEFSSTTFISPFEANNQPIMFVGWWGGWRATNEMGTGVLLATESFEKTKNDLEGIQIDRVDTKGWE